MKLAAARLMLLLTAQPVAATTWRKVETVKGYEGMRAEMQHLVDADPEVKTRLNHACVVVQSKGSEVGPIAWVHLRERGWLYAFTATDGPRIGDASIWGGASVDLKHDVVASVNDYHGSTGRRTRAYVNNIINHCKTDGDLSVIEKHHG